MRKIAFIFLALIALASPLSARVKKIYIKENDLITLDERLYVVLGYDKAYRVGVLHCSDARGYYFYKKDTWRVKAGGKSRHKGIYGKAKVS